MSKDQSWVERIGGGLKQGVETLGKAVLEEVYQGAGPQGAHELAAALFNGSAFVMYPRQHNAREDGHGVHGEQQQPPVQERGGMER